MRPDENERTEGLPPLRRGPGGGGSGGGGNGGGGFGRMPVGGGPPLVPEANDPFTTRDMPPGLFPSYNVRKPAKPPKPPRSRAPWIAAGSVVAVLAVVFGVLYASSRVAPHSGLGGILSGCGDNTPCGVAQNYLSDFSNGKYEAMYGLTSSASRQRFSDPKILSGPGFSYKDAHDYIVTRTSSFMDVARVTDVSASNGDIHQTSDTQATTSARIIYTSSLYGTIIENVTLPLRSEGGTWKVDWSPGLVVAQLDDPSGDPNYQRHVIANVTTGNRGTIWDNCTTSCDASKDLLAQDAPVWQILATTAKVSSENTLVSALSGVLNLPAAQIKTNYESRWNCGPSGMRLVATLTQQPSSAQQSALGGIAGVSVNATTGRVYPYGGDLGVVTGHIARITGDQLNADKSNYYNQCSMIGDTGVEAWGEQYLRPGQGGTLEIRNRGDGALYYTIATRAAANGDDVHTTINLADEQATIAAMRAQHVGHGSGAFAVDPSTGEVLVMASLPTSGVAPCDPNAFAQENFAVYQACISDSTNHPLINWALQAQVPTGSILKIATMAAALENGVATPDQTFPPMTSYQIPGQPTPINLNQPACQFALTIGQGLGRSCDLMYYMLGVQVDQKDSTLLPTMVRAFGYGASPNVVGIPSDEQAAGLVPDPAYYQQQKHANWAPVNAANLAIGQDDFQASPAQVAMASQAVANNGVRLQPRLVTSVTNGGAVVASFSQTQVGTLPISAQNLQALQAGMGNVAAPDGTTYDVFKNLPIQIAGKTGTAQNCDHCTVAANAWFTLYAPAAPSGTSSGTPTAGTPTPGTSSTPQIAGAALFIQGGSGNASSAPVLRALLVAHFHLPQS